jgi:hypothetical protein
MIVRKETKMTKTPNSATADFFGSIASAFRAAGSIRSGGQPKASDLKALGINPADFRKINQF